MLKQATTVNDVRPGEALEQQLGYLPEDGSYGCCNAHGQVSHAARVRHRGPRAVALRGRAGRQRRRGHAASSAPTTGRTCSTRTTTCSPAQLENGPFVAGHHRPTQRPTRTTSRATPTSTCGTCRTTTPALISALGGKPKVAPMLRQFLSQPNGFGMFAQLSNEFDFGEQYALNYAGDPAGTQQAVNNILNTMYPPGPERPAQQRRPRRQQLDVHLGDARHVPGELRAATRWCSTAPASRTRRSLCPTARPSRSTRPERPPPRTTSSR